MLLQQNGSDFHPHSYIFEMTDSSKVGEVRRFVNQLSAGLKLNDTIQGSLAIVVNELGNNLIKYAQHGQLIIRKLQSEDGLGVEILSVDRGPGMDSSKAVTDGYTTGSTPGTGLGAVQRQASYFDIYSSPGKGTIIVCGIFDSVKKAKNDYRIGVVNIPLQGELVSGDAWAVYQEGHSLSALMVDGLGHGKNANIAAKEAVAVFGESYADTLDSLLARVHGRMKSTRGGAVFLLKVNTNEVLFTGVGNIRTVICKYGKTKTLISQNGTAGLQIRRTAVLNEKWDDGVIVLHSDGINSRWDFSNYPGVLTKHPSIIAAVIARDFSRGTDDASVLVIGRTL